MWVTTRNPRAGEVDGVDYHFMEDFAFQVMKEQGRFLVAYQVSLTAASPGPMQKGWRCWW